jgi:hypothetical protein
LAAGHVSSFGCRNRLNAATIPALRRFFAFGVLVLGAWFASARAATPPDATLVLGLQTCVSNGIDSGVRTWYADREELGSQMSAKVLNESAKLGTLVDYEVVATQMLSKRVTRYYVALYFARGPLWMRIERYDNREKALFLPLRCSTNADEILPGYITEFYR